MASRTKLYETAKTFNPPSMAEQIIKLVITMIRPLYEVYSLKYKNEIRELLEDPHELTKIIRTHYTYNYIKTTPLELAFDKIEKTIAKYFIYSNGFIGRDIFQLKHVLSEIMIYLYLLNSELIEDSHKKICENEIETRFYFVLNCVYNIKTKFMSFTKFEIDNGKPIFKNSILSKSGEDLVASIFHKSYKVIGKYVNARNDIVHDNYEMYLDRENRRILIECFSFDLSTEKDTSKSKKHSFLINMDKIKQLMKTIYDLRKDTCYIILDRKNIDSNKLLEKFTYTENGKSIFSITE